MRLKDIYGWIVHGQGVYTAVPSRPPVA